MKNNIDILLNGVAVVSTAVQTNQTFQIISIVLTCVSIAVSLAFNVWKWWKLATKDKKITIDEIDELHEHIQNAIDETEKTIKGDDEK